MATTSTLFIQEFTENFHHSRRLLLIPTTVPQNYPEATMAPLAEAEISHVNTFDANVIMVLSVLVCALICSLALNSIIKCALKYSSSLVSASDSSSNYRNPSAAKLANTGIKKKALKTFPVITYTTELKHPGLDSECVICLSEFGVGEKIKVLPKCNHGFHVNCIDKWLNSHSSCPTCRNCLIEIINGGSSTTVELASNSTSSAPGIQEIIIRIESLQREGVTSNNQI
ncbi:RING-H2 finger protein ATL78-like [Nicotiana tomentosiformis]|uniref:RING-H2 finger protein ATL78-like n=1 Tax=Nicotiana tomentosiformis TaxID=4098 RepID=UPI00051C07E3|nr:RING-H2 finger protein ATL78-like [Nicotiana tomentosiformis]